MNPDFRDFFEVLVHHGVEFAIILCLEPHDLAIARYVARREKDIAFNRALAQRGLVNRERLLELLEKAPVAKLVRERIRSDIEHDFP